MEKQNIVPLTIGIVMVGVVIMGAVGLGGKKNETNVPVVATPTQKQEKENLDLIILTPVDGTRVDRARLTIRGKTSPGVEVAINDIDIVADSLGAFTTTVTLVEGETTLVVMANNEDGEYVEKEVVVTYEPKN